MIKNFLILSLFFAFFFSAAQVTTGALELPCQGDSPDCLIDISSKPQVTEVGGIIKIITRIVQWIYVVFLIVTVAFILLAAFNYLTAGDNSEKIKTAHKQLAYAAIAVAITLLATGFSLIIKNFIEDGGSQQGPPSGPQPTQPIQ